MDKYLFLDLEAHTWAITEATLSGDIAGKAIRTVTEAAHRFHSEWLNLHGLVGTELAVEILALMKPLPPPSYEFMAQVDRLMEIHKAKCPHCGGEL